MIAKGAHRRTKQGSSKFDGGVDLLDVGEAVFSQRLDKDLGLLTEWSLREGHLEIRKSLRAMYLGLYAAELMSLLFEEHDAHPDIYDRLELVLLELATPRVEEAFLAFELDLLRESGYLPETSACVGCGVVPGPRDPVYFSPSRGGIVCRSCEGVMTDRIGIDPRLLGLLQSILRLPKTNGSIQRLPRLSRHQTDPLNRIFADHLRHQLSRGLRMTAYVL